MCYPICGVFLVHIHRNLSETLNVHHLCFIKFPFSQTFFTEIKHFCPAWEDLPPKQGLSKPRVSWVDVDTWTNVIRKILFVWEKVCSHNAIPEIRQMSPFSRILELLSIYFCSEQGILSVGLLLCCLFLTGIYFRPSYSPSHIWPEQQRAGSKQQLCSS